MIVDLSPRKGLGCEVCTFGGRSSNVASPEVLSLSLSPKRFVAYSLWDMFIKHSEESLSQHLSGPDPG